MESETDAETRLVLRGTHKLYFYDDQLREYTWTIFINSSLCIIQGTSKTNDRLSRWSLKPFKDIVPHHAILPIVTAINHHVSRTKRLLSLSEGKCLQIIRFTDPNENSWWESLVKYKGARERLKWSRRQNLSWVFFAGICVFQVGWWLIGPTRTLSKRTVDMCSFRVQIVQKDQLWKEFSPKNDRTA